MIDILEIFEETGPGVFQLFAITVIGGVMTATFATLIVIPIPVTSIPQYLLTFEYENK